MLILKKKKKKQTWEQFYLNYNETKAKTILSALTTFSVRWKNTNTLVHLTLSRKPGRGEGNGLNC